MDGEFKETNPTFWIVVDCQIIIGQYWAFFQLNPEMISIFLRYSVFHGRGILLHKLAIPVAGIQEDNKIWYGCFYCLDSNSMVRRYRNVSLFGGMGKEHRAVVGNHLEWSGIRYYEEAICHIGQRQEDHEHSDVVQGRHIVLAGSWVLIPQPRHLPKLKPKFGELRHGIFAKDRVPVPYTNLIRNWEPVEALRTPLNSM